MSRTEARDRFIEEVRQAWLDDRQTTHWEGCHLTHARCAIAGLIDELERLVELVGPDHHVIRSDGQEFELQHPVRCRPHLMDCAVHRAMTEGTLEIEPGTFRVDDDLTMTREGQ